MVVFYDLPRSALESTAVDPLMLPTECGRAVESFEENAADPIVCHCLQVKQSTIVRVVQDDGARTLCDLAYATGAGGGCTACHRRLRQLLSHRKHAVVEAAEAPMAEVPVATSARLLPHPSATADNWPGRPPR